MARTIRGRVTEPSRSASARHDMARTATLDVSSAPFASPTSRQSLVHRRRLPPRWRRFGARGRHFARHRHRVRVRQRHFTVRSRRFPRHHHSPPAPRCYAPRGGRCTRTDNRRSPASRRRFRSQNSPSRRNNRSIVSLHRRFPARRRRFRSDNRRFPARRRSPSQSTLI